MAAASVTVSSTAFIAGSAIPADYTCEGSDRSPDLSWTWIPQSAKSVAIVVDDPNAPSGTFTHWIVWNIKPETRSVPAGAGAGALGGGMTGINDFGHAGYNGPCPPAGAQHVYRFTVYGLDAALPLLPTSKRADLDRAMNGHAVAQGALLGTFKH